MTAYRASMRRGSASDGGVLVGVPVLPARAVRVDAMLPEDVFHPIDRVTDRSRFRAGAARSKLAAV